MFLIKSIYMILPALRLVYIFASRVNKLVTGEDLLSLLMEAVVDSSRL